MILFKFRSSLSRLFIKKHNCIQNLLQLKTTPFKFRSIKIIFHYLPIYALVCPPLSTILCPCPQVAFITRFCLSALFCCWLSALVSHQLSVLVYCDPCVIFAITPFTSKFILPVYTLIHLPFSSYAVINYEADTEVDNHHQY